MFNTVHSISLLGSRKYNFFLNLGCNHRSHSSVEPSDAESEDNYIEYTCKYFVTEIDGKPQLSSSNKDQIFAI